MITKNHKTSITAHEGKAEIIIVREFDAPRELVFKAFTDETFFEQWTGPRDLKMRVELFEPFSGGSWRYISIDKEGKEFPFSGVFHEVQFPERIIQTFEFEGWPEKGHVALETVKFETLDGDRTKIIGQSVFQSLKDRNLMIQSGMEKGVNESHERLDELLVKILTKEESPID